MINFFAASRCSPGVLATLHYGAAETGIIMSTISKLFDHNQPVYFRFPKFEAKGKIRDYAHVFGASSRVAVQRAKVLRGGQEAAKIRVLSRGGVAAADGSAAAAEDERGGGRWQAGGALRPVLGFFFFFLLSLSA